MLWFKAWRQTRARFLICLGGIAAACLYSVYQDKPAHADTPLGYYYSLVHGAYGLVAWLWLGAVNLLMMGGILREKATGAASFTLALPVSRARLTGIRIAVGVMQATVLAAVPFAAVWLELAVIGKLYPISQVWFHFVLLTSGGSVLFAMALLVSSLVEGEYTAPVVSFGIMIGSAVLLANPRIQDYSPFRFMGGAAYYDWPTGLLVGPIPWLPAAFYVLLAASLTAASLKAISAREF
jgi:hypothetical protein